VSKSTPETAKKPRTPKSHVGLATPALSSRIAKAAEIDGISEAAAREMLAAHVERELSLDVILEVLDKARQERRKGALADQQPPPLAPDTVGIEDGVA
jgi:hypothetical protein